MSESETPKPLYENLPTGKPHLSFSELRDWQDCSFRHKLKYVDKIGLFEPAPIMDFGTAVHSACEDFLRSREMKPEIAVESIKKFFETHKARPAYHPTLLATFLKEAASICNDVPKFMDETFPDWQYVDAEHNLYEPMEKYPHAFKGFIDGIIKTKGKRGEDLHWLIDWKTTAWGWTADKKSDPKVHQQLIFYKNYWTTKTVTNPKDVRCGFVLLKRTAKSGSHCELIKVSVGDVTTGRSLKVLNSAVNSIRKGLVIKNRGSCQYCEYKDTEFCPLNDVSWLHSPHTVLRWGKKTMTSVAKKTILMMADHPLSTSGVGTQARWLINGLIATGKYRFRVFGGAVRHDNYDEVVVNEDFIIKPTNGFGDKQLLRKALVQLKPDALLLFTDPRFFLWAWEMEDEIHQVCPITYNHLWDNPPWPEFNRVLYDSTDLINCINWPTYEMVHKRFPDKTHYVPHGVPKELFKPLPAADIARFKRSLLGPERADHFMVLFVSRNARRKMPSDILVSWRMFLEELKAKHGHAKATFIMHADPLDPEGANLHHVIDVLQIKDSVVFSKDRVGFPEMVGIYNMVDVVVNRSCFAAGTRVVVKDRGYVPIEEVAIGDQVLTHKRRWKPVIDLIRNDGRSKRMIQLKITNSNPVRCTDDHKLLAIKRRDLPANFFFNVHGQTSLDYARLTPASELMEGDYLVSSYEGPKLKLSDITITPWELVKDDTYLRAGHKSVPTYEKNDNRIISRIMMRYDHGPAELSLTQDVAYVLGNWTADGTTHSTSISFDKKHPDRVEKYIEAVKNGFGMDCTINERKSHVEVCMRNGAVMARMFMSLCGKYSTGKHVPECILHANDELKRAYLAGYLAGDGCTLKHPQYGHFTHRIRTISNSIAFGLRHILVDLGYVPNVYESSNAHGYNKAGRIWTIEWRDRVGNQAGNGSCRSWNINGNIISRINGIHESNAEDVVYDLTVDEDHTYMVENVTVSNCNEGFGLGTLEAMMCGKPIIALKTGGLTRQVEDPETKEQYGIAMEPEVKCLVGNQLVPYIFEDFVSHETVAKAFMKMYEMGPEARAELGAKAMAHAHKDYDLQNTVNKWDETLTECIENWQGRHQRWSNEEL